MRDEKKRANALVGHNIADHAAHEVKDPAAQKLLRTARGVGNVELQQRLQSGNASRDELLAFITQRLGTLREAQLRELGEHDHQREWARKVADSQNEAYTKPDPTQWGEPARLYEEAAAQLCRGALGRGAQLMERALDVEQKKLGDLSKVVNIAELDREAELPSAAQAIAPTQGCGDVDVPAELAALAQSIQAVTTQFDDPAVKKRVADPWWTLEEEEEEEEEGGA